MGKINLILGGILMLTCLAIVFTHHLTRKQFIAIDRVLKEHDVQTNEWTQLLLEQSAWSSDGRVEKMAGEKLSMHLPVNPILIKLAP
jgi:cell division protein FtsL